MVIPRDTIGTGAAYCAPSKATNVRVQSLSAASSAPTSPESGTIPIVAY